MIDEKLVNSLYKKAIGYTAKEKTTEYSAEGDVIKQKVTSKHYPPDISALKAYLEIVSEEGALERMTDEELAEEKKRLLKLLEETENGTDKTESQSKVRRLVL